MAQKPEDILDECVTKIVNEGATVEDCLARFPQRAADLEELLWTTALLAGVSAIRPRAAAKAAARRWLQAELEAAENSLPEAQTA